MEQALETPGMAVVKQDTGERTGGSASVLFAALGSQRGV
jgi:hypothetical protein